MKRTDTCIRVFVPALKRAAVTPQISKAVRLCKGMTEQLADGVWSDLGVEWEVERVVVLSFVVFKPRPAVFSAVRDIAKALLETGEQAVLVDYGRYINGWIMYEQGDFNEQRS